MRPRTSREEIERLLARKERDRLSYAALAEETGISRHTLASWASRLRREASQADEPSFVEVVVQHEDPDHNELVEIVVDDRVVLRVRRGFCAETLARVLSTITSTC